MSNRVTRVTCAILVAAVVSGVQTAGAAPAATLNARHTVTSQDRDRTGKLWPRLHRFLVLIGFGDDMVGPRP